MSATKLSVTWDSYKNSISKGFSHLQQNGEFVDMTLAAEGHLVKVHQNMVALASPYLKAMIQSASCQHPVVFLNNISHGILGFILEYIYTGEVKIPTDVITEFVEACKSLCITGVENITLHKKQAQALPEQPEPTRTTESPDNNYAAHITINSENYNLEVMPIVNNVTQDLTLPIISVENLDSNYESQIYSVVKNFNNIEQDNSIPNILVDNVAMDIESQSAPFVINKEVYQSNILTNADNNTNDPNIQNGIMNRSVTEIKPIKHQIIKTATSSKGVEGKPLQYTISNRGSLQLMLNRYLYYCHHHSCGGRKRRWRCADYRKLHCPAFIDTDDDVIINRSEVHCHAYHDIKILRKFKSKSVFTSLSKAEEKVTTFKEKPPKLHRDKKCVGTIL